VIAGAHDTLKYLGRPGEEMIRPLGLTVVDNGLVEAWWNSKGVAMTARSLGLTIVETAVETGRW
jgi:hypothetical protein